MRRIRPRRRFPELPLEGSQCGLGPILLVRHVLLGALQLELVVLFPILRFGHDTSPHLHGAPLYVRQVLFRALSPRPLVGEFVLQCGALAVKSFDLALCHHRRRRSRLRRRRVLLLLTCLSRVPQVVFRRRQLRAHLVALHLGVPLRLSCVGQLGGHGAPLVLSVPL